MSEEQKIFGDYELAYQGSLYQLTYKSIGNNMWAFQDHINVHASYQETKLTEVAQCPGINSYDCKKLSMTGLNFTGEIDAPEAEILDLPDLLYYTEINAPKAKIINMPKAQRVNESVMREYKRDLYDGNKPEMAKYMPEVASSRLFLPGFSLN